MAANEIQPGQEYEVTLRKADVKAAKLEEREGVGVVVTAVAGGSNAASAGIEAGDIILATSASMGWGMWPKTTLSGVEAAIQTRIDGQVRLRLRRPGADARLKLWEGDLTHTYEVDLSPPLGMVLRDAGPEGAAASAQSSPRGQRVEVLEVAAGGSAAASNAVRAGDVVLATSGTVGDTLWEKSTLEGVLSSLSTRLAIRGSVRLRLSRAQRLGPWARELYEIARGERIALSLAARCSLRAQRRELRAGWLTGQAVMEGVRDLCCLGVASTSDARVLTGVLRRLAQAQIPLDPRLTTLGMGRALQAGAPGLAMQYFARLNADGGKADVKARRATRGSTRVTHALTCHETRHDATQHSMHQLLSQIHTPAPTPSPTPPGRGAPSGVHLPD